LDAAGGALPPVFAPRRTGNVAAGDALDVDAVRALHEHAPAGQRVRVPAQRLGILAHVVREQVVGHDVAGAPEPEGGELIEHLPLVGNCRRQHHVERGDPIGRDDE